MAAPEKLSLHRAPEAAGALREAVAAGEYATAEAEAAVWQWAEQRALFGFTRGELGALARAGLDSGPSRLAGMDDVKAEARRRRMRGRGSDATPSAGGCAASAPEDVRDPSTRSSRP